MFNKDNKQKQPHCYPEQTEYYEIYYGTECDVLWPVHNNTALSHMYESVQL